MLLFILLVSFIDFFKLLLLKKRNFVKTIKKSDLFLQTNSSYPYLLFSSRRCYIV